MIHRATESGIKSIQLRRRPIFEIEGSCSSLDFELHFKSQSNLRFWDELLAKPRTPSTPCVRFTRADLYWFGWLSWTLHVVQFKYSCKRSPQHPAVDVCEMSSIPKPPLHRNVHLLFSSRDRGGGLRQIYLHKIDKGEAGGGTWGLLRKEVRKCPLGDVDLRGASVASTEKTGRRGRQRERERERGGEGGDTL